jgi:hypothetical protein
MSGHAVMTCSACAERIAEALIANLAESPDTSHLADLEPRWVLPSAGTAPNGHQGTLVAVVAGSRLYAGDG